MFYQNSKKEIKTMAEENIKVIAEGKKPKYGALLYGALREIDKKRRIFNICTTMGSKFVAVSVTGEIFPRHRFISFPETKIGDVWNGIDKAWLETMTKIHIFNSEVCSKCWLRYICGGNCPNTNYLIGKSFVLREGSSPVFCKAIKILFEEALILYAILKDIRR